MTPCSATSGVLGGAGPNVADFNFTNAPEIGCPDAGVRGEVVRDTLIGAGYLTQRTWRRCQRPQHTSRLGVQDQVVVTQEPPQSVVACGLGVLHEMSRDVGIGGGPAAGSGGGD